MKKSSKYAKFIILSIVLSISVVYFSITNFINKYTSFGESYNEIIESNWDIKLPDGYKEIYKIKNKANILGDGTRYHIFEYTDNTDLSTVLEWSSIADPKVEIEINNILKMVDVPTEDFPNFSYYYKFFVKNLEDNSKIYIILIEEFNKVYIIENIY